MSTGKTSAAFAQGGEQEQELSASCAFAECVAQHSIRDHCYLLSQVRGRGRASGAQLSSSCVAPLQRARVKRNELEKRLSCIKRNYQGRPLNCSPIRGDRLSFA